MVRDSWINFRDKMSMEARKCPYSSVISGLAELSRGEVSTISGLLTTGGHIACWVLTPGLCEVTTLSSMIGASEAQKLWDFSRPFLFIMSLSL